MIKAEKHANVAVFVPHAGCPHQCAFCNQRHIAGVGRLPTAADVAAACETARRTVPSGTHCQLAFFGGSFTAIDHTVMVALLEAAAPYVADGTVSGIRVSTRPDAVDDEVLTILKRYGVTTVELGAQSMDDTVLALCRRGHTAKQVEQAAQCVQRAGLSLGLQMMTGLPGDTDEGAMETARRLAALRPDEVRIYPTLVMADTPLAEQYRAGAYHPQDLEQAVTLCARLLSFFEEEHGIPVIRLGLHTEDDMVTHCLSGPFHPAFRELCEGRLMLEKARRLLSGYTGQYVHLRVHPSCVSRMVGHRRENREALLKEGHIVKVIADARVAYGDIQVEEVSTL